MKTMAFKGSNVFMSRKLVPPEIFDALRDALKLNGAEVFLCSDPNRTSPDDFHVISAPDHEKFKDLRAKGCNLIGPQCVFSCAREHRAFPKQGYTCCLAMDNVKVLVSGFDTEEKSKIEKMVAAMGGTLISKTSTDVSFVVVKNVMAAKYKWALYTLKKPTVTIDWLDQCWNEHRIVPHESFRVLPFSGLTICTTGATVSREERMEMAKVILKNGGKYSSELNRKCTHLISDTPEGDKYKVARRWGHIYIVTRKWFDQSIARRACLDEESYPVRSGFASSSKGVKGSVKMQLSQGNDNSNLQSVQSSLAMETNSAVAPSTGLVDSDMEASISQNTSSTVPTRPVFGEEGDNIESVGQPQCETNLTNLDGCVADDSQSEDDDLYLSECRVLLTGFEAPEMRRLVNMVRRGGGSRHVQFNDKLTHIVIGSPSESEKKDIRSYAASGIVHVVRMTWLEDCDRLKKEVSVYQRHIAQDLLLPKGALPVMNCVNHDKLSVIQLSLPSDNQSSEAVSAGTGRTTSLEKYRAEQTEINMTRVKSVAAETKSPQQSKPTVVDGAHKGQGNDKKSSKISQQNSQNRKFSDVFKGKMFDFSSTFPEERKGEIVQWIKQGQGEVIDAFLKQSAHFTIECHGVTTKSSYASKSIYVSSHWVRSCLEDGRLLEVNSHILYSPLPCWIPFPGFEKIRFCVSQYEDKDRLLLRNLCFVLGAKLVQRLTKNVTHLLCKYAIGPKYEAACKWKISSVTSEWIYECVKKNKLVSLDLFAPKVVTAEDQEAGLCDMTQFTTQGAQMIPGERPSQFPSQFEDTRTMPSGNLGFGSICQVEAAAARENISKKARLLKDDGQKGLLSTSGTRFSAPTCSENSTGERISNNVPDVASAIEDLLEQTSKIHEQKSPGNTSIDETIFSSNPSTHGHDRLDTHSISGFSKHWPASGAKKDECSGVKNEGMHDGFSETQSESQVVGYEEDLSGRQMLIDKVRTRSSMI